MLFRSLLKAFRMSFKGLGQDIEQVLGYVDSKNLISVLLDPASMSDEELLTVLR